jgi:hypothetical protein
MLEIPDLVTAIDVKIEALKIAERTPAQIQADLLMREGYLRTATAA